MNTANLRCAAVSKRYGELEAVRNVTFEVSSPQLIAFVGPSGCGKTTLLRLIGALEPPSSGVVSYDTEEERTDAIGFVFQSPALLPWRTVNGNVRLPLTIAGVHDSEERVLEALRRVELEAFATAYPQALSGGMQHRVSLARVLVQRSALWLMDEPFAALDEISRREMAVLVRHLWEDRRIMAFFVTHSVEEAVLVADRVLVLSARPAQIVADIAVELSAPRSLAALQDDTFTRLVRDVRRALANETVVAGEG